MDLMPVVRDSRRYLNEAMKALAAVNAGVEINPEITRAEAVQRLTENIERYERILLQYGWRESPSESLVDLRYAA